MRVTICIHVRTGDCVHIRTYTCAYACISMYAYLHVLSTFSAYAYVHKIFAIVILWRIPYTDYTYILYINVMCFYYRV